LSDSGLAGFSAATNCLMSARTAVLDAALAWTANRHAVEV
jgi:hypothetical protein